MLNAKLGELNESINKASENVLLYLASREIKYKIENINIQIYFKNFDK